MIESIGPSLRLSVLAQIQKSLVSCGVWCGEGIYADALASMSVRCDVLGLNHTVGLLTHPLTPQERADLRWYLEEYPQWAYAEFAARGKRIEAQLSEIGKRLYQAAFGAVMGQVQP